MTFGVVRQKFHSTIIDMHRYSDLIRTASLQETAWRVMDVIMIGKQKLKACDDDE